MPPCLGAFLRLSAEEIIISKPLVSIIMGSSNDWEIMSQAEQQLKVFGAAYDARVISAMMRRWHNA